MTAKEFLSLPNTIKQRMEGRHLHIEELRAQAERSTSSWNIVTGGRRDPHAREAIIAELADEQTELLYDLDDYLTAQEAVSEVLKQLPMEDSKIYAVMSLRYLSGLTWPKVAEVMGMSQKNAFKINKKFIDQLEVPEKWRTIEWTI